MQSIVPTLVFPGVPPSNPSLRKETPLSEAIQVQPRIDILTYKHIYAHTYEHEYVNAYLQVHTRTFGPPEDIVKRTCTCSQASGNDVS